MPDKQFYYVIVQYSGSLGVPIQATSVEEALKLARMEAEKVAGPGCYTVGASIEKEYTERLRDGRMKF